MTADSQALSGRVVLLATDGSPAAEAATHVAHALSMERGARIHVASVVDTGSAPIPPPLDIAFAMGDAAIGPKVHEDQARDVRAMIAKTTGQPCSWPVHVMLGTPGGAIAGTAARVGAALIVLGLRRHGRLDRVVHDETVLNVMRAAKCPVLGVTEQLSRLPVRALAALDFSQSSQEAARVAASLVGAAGTVVLAYAPPITGYLPGDGELTIHELGVQAGLDQVSSALKASVAAVDRIVLHHQTPRPASELLLEYAEEMRADLIVAGSARHSRLDQWMLGSVSTELVRAGTTSVLIVPPVKSAV